MSKEKIKDKRISKESLLYHNELPNEIVNKMKLLIDNSSNDNDKFGLIKDIYKKQIDNVNSLISDGYKIDVALDDENDLSSYMFIGYIYRKNFSDKQEERDKQKEEFNNTIYQFSYYNYENNSYKSIDEMLAVLRKHCVKKEMQCNTKDGAILPVVLINQYKDYNSMLKMNSNIFCYYSQNEEKIISDEYKKNIENPYIMFNLNDVDSMIDWYANGKKRLDFDNSDNYFVSKAFDIKNVKIKEFDTQIFGEYISFDILNTIVWKNKCLRMYIPVYIKKDINKYEDIEKKSKELNADKKVKNIANENSDRELSKNKYELEMNKRSYYDEDFTCENVDIATHITVYNGLWGDVDENTRLDSDFCKTSFCVSYINEINVGILEIKFNIRFISPNRIGRCLNNFYEGSYIKNEILSVVNKYNSEKDLKIKLFDDLEYNHFLTIDNYYSINWENKEDKYLKNIKNKLEEAAICNLDISPIMNNACYLGKKSGLIIGWIEEIEFLFSLLKYFIINNLSNSLIDELITMKNANTFNIDCEKTLLNLDKEYLEFSMLSSRDLYGSNINYNKIEEYDKKFHIEDIDIQYKKNLNMYKEIVDIESKKQGNSLANKLNTIQIMSILLTIIGWGLVIAQANILNKTLNYFIIITFAAISGLLAAIFINNFISNK